MGSTDVVEWVRRRPAALDLAFVLLFVAALAVVYPLLPLHDWLLMLAQLAPVALRHRAPFAAAALVAAACLWQVVTLETPLPSNVSVLLVIYSAAAWATPRWKSLAVLGMGLVGAVMAGVDWLVIDSALGPGSLADAVPQVVALAMGVLAAWLLGDVVRRRRLVLERMQAQNDALARDQAQRARLAAQDERASIAREMHDIVAHSLSVVVVQADGGAYAARRALDGDPSPADRAALEQAARTLEVLARTARTSLADTRRLVGVLRDSEGPEYAPQQGLDHVEELVDRVRGAGVPVQLALRGDLTGLDPETGRAAYRVVQEALTNVLKHAGTDASATVDLLGSRTDLLVRVSDDGQGQTEHDGQGNGIVGMTERVEVLGGSLWAGPRAGAGFEVVASIPVGRDRPEDRR